LAKGNKQATEHNEKGLPKVKKNISRNDARTGKVELSKGI